MPYRTSLQSRSLCLPCGLGLLCALSGCRNGITGVRGYVLVYSLWCQLVGLLTRNFLVPFWAQQSCLRLHIPWHKITEVHSHLDKEVCAFTRFITVGSGEYQLRFHLTPCLWEFDFIPLSLLSIAKSPSLFISLSLQAICSIQLLMSCLSWLH